jgi:hypothetical protein
MVEILCSNIAMATPLPFSLSLLEFSKDSGDGLACMLR